jgi:hypothetical protein
MGRLCRARCRHLPVLRLTRQSCLPHALGHDGRARRSRASGRADARQPGTGTRHHGERLPQPRSNATSTAAWLIWASAVAVSRVKGSRAHMTRRCRRAAARSGSSSSLR